MLLPTDAMDLPSATQASPVVHPMPSLPSTYVPTFHLSESDMGAEFEATIMRIHRQCGNEFGVVKVRPPAQWQRRLDNVLYSTMLRPGSAGINALNTQADSFDAEECKIMFDQLVASVPLGRPATEYVVRQPTHPWAFHMDVRYEYDPMPCSDFQATADVEDEPEVDGGQIPLVEEQYWQHVAQRANQPKGTEESMIALYGCDVRRSLFPPSFVDKWNLNTLDSLLTRAGGRKVAIPGVDRPYLYFGSRFSSFALHTEDLELFSINYHWMGAPKIWYSAAPRDFHHVRATCAKLYPDMLKEDAEFMRFKQCIVHPGLLMDAGCAMARAEQEPGDFIITFPSGFHGGFNTGFNCAEAVNMCTEDWLPYARRARWSKVDENAVWIAPDVLEKMERVIQASPQKFASGKRRKPDTPMGMFTPWFEHSADAVLPPTPTIHDSVSLHSLEPAATAVDDGQRRSLRVRQRKRTYSSVFEFDDSDRD